MTDENWLRDGLADAVPTPPASPDRADGARAMARRARRTTAVVIGGAAASVLAVAGVVAVVSGGEGSPHDADDVVAASPYDAPACPASPVDARTQVGPDHVPDGASSVRLCAGNGNPIEVPVDALVTGVDEVAEAVNGLPTAAADQGCTMELGPGYQLVFAYSDGPPVVASGDLYGCRPVVVHGVERTGADVPWQRFIDLLRAQRERLRPQAPDASRIDCAAQPASPTLGRAQDLAVAAVCVGDGTPATVTDDELDLLLGDMAAHTTKNAGYVDCASSPPFPRIVGLTTWGDRVEIRSDCGDSWFSVDDATNSIWQPSPAAGPIIERLVAKAR